MVTRRGYQRRDVGEAQSDLCLLWELDQHTFQVVTAFIKDWNAMCLDAENQMPETRR